MSKILLYSIVFCMFVGYLATPAETCTGKKNSNNHTGSACSVADLRGMSKYKYAQENSVVGPPSEKNLRPILTSSSEQIPKNDGTGCRIGLCITSELFNSRQ